MHKFTKLASATDCNWNCTHKRQVDIKQTDRLRANNTEDLQAKLPLIYYRKRTEGAVVGAAFPGHPFQPTQLNSSAAAVSFVSAP